MDRSPSYTVELKEILLLLSEPLQKTYIHTHFSFYRRAEQQTFISNGFLKKQISFQLKNSKEQDKNNEHITSRWGKKKPNMTC